MRIRSCDYRSLDNLTPDTEFVSVPLNLQVGETIYTDNAQLNIDQMMEEMYATATAYKSAYPSPDDYMKAFEGANNIVVVTITGPFLVAIIVLKSLRKFIWKSILILRFTSLIACQLVARSTFSLVSSINWLLKALILNKSLMLSQATSLKPSCSLSWQRSIIW